MGARVRVLLSEGSSLSARESVTALGLAGFRVEVVDSNPLCLARFSRFCRRVHGAPAYGADPAGYLERIIDLLTREHIDVLFPAHEQAFLFARYSGALSRLTHLALPDFEVFERMQSKVGFSSVLETLGLPAPPTVIAKDERTLRMAARVLPVYLKTAFGTATRGVFLVRSAQEVQSALEAIRPVLVEGVLVQRPAQGQLERAQAVFDRGRLVGFHACRQLAEGVGGGDLLKESARAPRVREHFERIGSHLCWHGGLSLDYLIDAAGMPRYIDSNPRLAEIGNALAAGLNLPELLVQVSLGDHPAERRAGRAGARTFMGAQALLRAARDHGARGVARTSIDLALRRGPFSGATEELTPATVDAPSLLPLAALALALVSRPSLWKRLSAAAIDAYAATPRVLEFIRRAESACPEADRAANRTDHHDRRTSTGLDTQPSR